MLQILNLSVYNTDFYAFVFQEQAKVVQNNPLDPFAELIFEDFAGMGDVSLSISKCFTMPTAKRENNENHSFFRRVFNTI